MFKPELIRELYQKENVKGKIPEKMGVSKTNLSQIMNGKVSPTVETLENIAKYFKKTIGYFFNEADANALNAQISNLQHRISFLENELKHRDDIICRCDAHIETLIGKKEIKEVS
jgi:transcriptional regulator with XRE-family HTH domain